MRSGSREMLIVALVLFTTAFASTARGQAARCEAAPQVKAALRNLPESTGDWQADRAARIAALEVLRKRYPNDLFVHSRYQDEATEPTVKERDAVIEEYHTLATKHPNNAVYTYLAARARIGVHTKYVLPELEALAGRVPPARLSLVRIYQTTNFRDAKKAREHLEAFMTACPAALSAYSYLRSIEPSGFLTRSTATLRTLLASRTDPEAIGSYSTLWSLEFRVKPPSEHEALREQVRSDLKRLRRVDTGAKADYFVTMQNGYKLTNDAEGARWAGEQVRIRSPRGSLAYDAVVGDWDKANPYPRETEPPEKRQAYFDAYLKVAGAWARQLPDNTRFWLEHVGMLRQADHALAADVEAAGERLLQIVAKNPRMVIGPNFPLVVARLYATKSVRLDRLPDLVRDGLAALDAPPAFLPSDLYDRPAAAQQESAEYERWDAWRTIADIWLKAKDKERAREALAQVQTLADQSKPRDLKDPKYADKQRAYLSRQVIYWQAMGDLAQLDGRKLDAITFYQNALLARAEPPPATQRDELGEKARALWTEAGGSNEAWQAWYTRRDLFGESATDPAAGGGWAKTEKTLPDFELPDLTGVTWRLADFKGKTTLVGIWATW